MRADFWRPILGILTLCILAITALPLAHAEKTAKTPPVASAIKAAPTPSHGKPSKVEPLDNARLSAAMANIELAKVRHQAAFLQETRVHQEEVDRIAKRYQLAEGDKVDPGSGAIQRTPPVQTAAAKPAPAEPAKASAKATPPVAAAPAAGAR